jgi:hypothetical protein
VVKVCTVIFHLCSVLPKSLHCVCSHVMQVLSASSVTASGCLKLYQAMRLKKLVPHSKITIVLESMLCLSLTLVFGGHASRKML